MDLLLKAATPALEVAGRLLDPDEARPDGLYGAAVAALSGVTWSGEAEAEGLGETAFADARLALAALLDELALRDQGALAERWRQEALLQQRFVHPNLTTAGDRFFDRLGELITAPRSAANLSVLRLYAICLELGFKGRFAARDESPALIKLRALVQRRLGAIALSSPAPPSPPPRLRPSISLKLLPRLAALCLLATVVALVIDEVRLVAADRQLAMQDPIPPSRQPARREALTAVAEGMIPPAATQPAQQATQPAHVP